MMAPGRIEWRFGAMDQSWSELLSRDTHGPRISRKHLSSAHYKVFVVSTAGIAS